MEKINNQINNQKKNEMEKQCSPTVELSTHPSRS